MAYRQTGPQVVDYNRGSYDGYNHSSPNHSNLPHHTESYLHSGSGGPHRTVSETREFYQTQNAGFGRTVQQPNAHWKLDQHHDNRHHDRKDRFDTYRPKDYKYNFFSMIDEPWNRCCQFKKCGKFPGNQCIAKNTPNRDWL